MPKPPCKPRFKDEHELELLQAIVERKQFSLDSLTYHVFSDSELNKILNALASTIAERDAWRKYATEVESKSVKGD